MIDKRLLTGPFAQGGELERIENIVIMLHGYGSNGDDLIQIAQEWKENLPQILFSAPNAPFDFNGFHEGFIWFEVYPDGIPIDQASKKQQEKVMNDYNKSCHLIEQHIYNLSKEHNISLNKFFLLGFSQGSMMGIEVGTKLNKPVAGIISLSGRIYSEDFNQITRNKCPILVAHGDNDNIIPPSRFYETCEILEKSNYKVEKHLIKNMGHSINSNVSEISMHFIKNYR